MPHGFPYNIYIKKMKGEYYMRAMDKIGASVANSIYLVLRIHCIKLEGII